MQIKTTIDILRPTTRMAKWKRLTIPDGDKDVQQTKPSGEY